MGDCFKATNDGMTGDGARFTLGNRPVPTRWKGMVMGTFLARLTTACEPAKLAVHVVYVHVATDTVRSLCGEWLSPDNTTACESLDDELPCVACQLLSDDPEPSVLAWAASLDGLERRP